MSCPGLFHVFPDFSRSKRTNLSEISSVKWGHLAHLDPNSTKTIFSTNTMGSTSPL